MGAALVSKALGSEDGVKAMMISGPVAAAAEAAAAGLALAEAAAAGLALAAAEAAALAGAADAAGFAALGVQHGPTLTHAGRLRALFLGFLVRRTVGQLQRVREADYAEHAGEQPG